MDEGRQIIIRGTCDQLPAVVAIRAPHAHYVKSLTNNNRLTSTSDKIGERSTAKYGSLVAATSSSVVSCSKDGDVFGRIIEEATSNMYAVRVKKRLLWNNVRC